MQKNAFKMANNIFIPSTAPSLNAFGVSSSSWYFGAGGLNRFLSMVVCIPAPHPLSFFPSTDSFSVDGCVEWKLITGLRDLPAMGAVFYLGVGWPQWKPLDIPGTHPPLKRGSGLIGYKMIIFGYCIIMR